MVKLILTASHWVETYVVNNHGNGGDIDSSGQHVCCDEHLGLAGSELIDDSVTLRALNATRQGSNGVTFRDHALLNFLGRRTSLVRVRDTIYGRGVREQTLTKMIEEPTVSNP